MKRCTASESFSATRCSTFTAARRLSSGCSASNTAPNPPSPSSRPSRYSPAIFPALSLCETRARLGGESAIVAEGGDDITQASVERNRVPLDASTSAASSAADGAGSVAAVTSHGAGPSAPEANVDTDRRGGWMTLAIERRAEALARHAGARGSAETLRARAFGEQRDVRHAPRFGHHHQHGRARHVVQRRGGGIASARIGLVERGL